MGNGVTKEGGSPGRASPAAATGSQHAGAQPAAMPPANTVHANSATRQKALAQLQASIASADKEESIDLDAMESELEAIANELMHAKVGSVALTPQPSGGSDTQQSGLRGHASPVTSLSGAAEQLQKDGSPPARRLSPQVASPSASRSVGSRRAEEGGGDSYRGGGSPGGSGGGGEFEEGAGGRLEGLGSDDSRVRLARGPDGAVAVDNIASAQVGGGRSGGRDASGRGSDASIRSNAGGGGGTLRWQRGEMIGAGSFGKVYLGFNLGSGEMMAVKQISIGTGTGHHAHGGAGNNAREILSSIESEVSCLQGLRHPNIVQYLGVERDEAEGTLSIFLEYVAGGSIHALISKFGAFNESLCRRYMRHILAGVDYLHAHKIVHR